MEAYGRDLHGESEALRMLSQTHLHSSSSNEMHRYAPFRDQSQMLQSFAHTHPPNFHVGTLFICFTSCIIVKNHETPTFIVNINISMILNCGRSCNYAVILNIAKNIYIHKYDSNCSCNMVAETSKFFTLWS